MPLLMQKIDAAIGDTGGLFVDWRYSYSRGKRPIGEVKEDDVA